MLRPKGITDQGSSELRFRVLVPDSLDLSHALHLGVLDLSDVPSARGWAAVKELNLKYLK